MSSCYRCRIGRLKPAQAPYAQMVDGNMLILPDMPAAICDVCGEIEYDADIMINIQYLVHQHEVRHSRPIRRSPQTRSVPPKPPIPKGL